MTPEAPFDAWQEVVRSTEDPEDPEAWWAEGVDNLK
jgi:hypothetical protein